MFTMRLRSNLALLAAATTITLAGAGAALAQGGAGGSGGGGGGGGGVAPPSGCVAQITSVSNTSGYGPYSPYVASIKTRFTVRNCTGAAVGWQARISYDGVFFGGPTFAVPLTCALPIAASSSASCSISNRYLYIQHTYGLTLEVMDATGAVLATSSASVDTPRVPNPGPVV